MEPAVIDAQIETLDDVEKFCRGRLRTAGVVSASFAAVAHALWRRGASVDEWQLLDAECSARLPSEALRLASRSLGSGLRRLLRSMAPEADVDSAWVLVERPAPHHPIV